MLLLLLLLVVGKMSVDLLEDFSVDDIERQGLARGWAG